MERTLDEVTAYVKKTMKECESHDVCVDVDCPMFRLEQILGLREYNDRQNSKSSEPEN